MRCFNRTKQSAQCVPVIEPSEGSSVSLPGPESATMVLVDAISSPTAWVAIQEMPGVRKRLLGDSLRQLTQEARPFRMRNFNSRFRLRDTRRHIRLLYTFCVFLMLVGLIFSFFWAHSMAGLSPQGIADHYRGSDATYGEPMSFQELAEVIHFHLFTMPVVFMILVHVLYLTDASNTTKAATTWASFCGESRWIWICCPLGSLLVFVITMLTGDILMTTSFLVMMTIPLYEMWFLEQPLIFKRSVE